MLYASGHLEACGGGGERVRCLLWCNYFFKYPGIVEILMWHFVQSNVKVMLSLRALPQLVLCIDWWNLTVYYNIWFQVIKNKFEQNIVCYKVFVALDLKIIILCILFLIEFSMKMLLLRNYRCWSVKLLSFVNSKRETKHHTIIYWMEQGYYVYFDFVVVSCCLESNKAAHPM